VRRIVLGGSYAAAVAAGAVAAVQQWTHALGEQETKGAQGLALPGSLGRNVPAVVVPAARRTAPPVQAAQPVFSLPGLSPVPPTPGPGTPPPPGGGGGAPSVPPSSPSPSPTPVPAPAPIPSPGGGGVTAAGAPTPVAAALVPPSQPAAVTTKPHTNKPKKPHHAHATPAVPASSAPGQGPATPATPAVPPPHVSPGHAKPKKDHKPPKADQGSAPQSTPTPSEPPGQTDGHGNGNGNGNGNANGHGNGKK
jgi:hypothetical protein